MQSFGYGCACGKNTVSSHGCCRVSCGYLLRVSYNRNYIWETSPSSLQQKFQLQKCDKSDSFA